MEYGFVKVAAAVPQVEVANIASNAEHIINLIAVAHQRGVRVLVFPQLSLSAYTCGDLFGQSTLVQQAMESISTILEKTIFSDVVCIIGMPLVVDGRLLNVALVAQGAKVLGIVPRRGPVSHGELLSQRCFANLFVGTRTDFDFLGSPTILSANLVVRLPEATVGVVVGDDARTLSGTSALRQADIICHLAADDESVGRYAFLKQACSVFSSQWNAGYIYCSCGMGESTTDRVFAGNALIYEQGDLLAEAPRYSTGDQLVVSDIDVELLRHDRCLRPTMPETTQPLFVQARPSGSHTDRHLDRTINTHPFVPEGAKLDDRCQEVFGIQVAALARRLRHTHSQTAVVGISGGLDSTLALLVCIKAFDWMRLPRTNILGITMPGFGTTDRTYRNALQLMRQLGITMREISIRDACMQHFKDIGHDVQQHDVTYENAQARERTQILMDIANQTNGLVIGTGDLSELALGWATYNGDHMSMYGVNASVPKSLVQGLVRWVAVKEMDEETCATLLDIVDTPISPELMPADNDGHIQQKTEDLVGPYELHDFFIYHFMRHGFGPRKIYFMAQQAFADKYAPATLKHWLTTFCRRFINQQFKRSCLPDGPKVGEVSLSPRGAWHAPSDASAAVWLKECEML